MQIIDLSENESLIVNSRVEVKVLEVCPEWIRLGITDPDHSQLYREEIISLEGAGRESDLLPV